jgi:hypothetical protein
MTGGQRRSVMESSITCAFHQIQSVHMKCVPFYCNTAYELKGRGMKIERIWLGCMIKFIIRAT